MICFPKKYCFVIGEQFDKNIFDSTLLESEITIACNYTINVFTPTVYFAGSQEILKYLVNNHNFNNNTLYLLSPTALIVNCYDINTMTPWISNNQVIKNNTQSSYCHPDILDKLNELVNNHKNIFLIENLKKLILTKNLNSIINKELLITNLNYADKYRNIIPMVILKYIKQHDVNYVFLLGCNINSYCNSNKEDIYNGIKLRSNKYSNINIINSSIEENESLDFLINYDLIKLLNYYKSNNNDINTLISDYVNYCKIDILKNKDKEDIIKTLLSELDNILNNNDTLDYKCYEKISNIINLNIKL